MNAFPDKIYFQDAMQDGAFVMITNANRRRPVMHEHSCRVGRRMLRRVMIRAYEYPDAHQCISGTNLYPASDSPVQKNVQNLRNDRRQSLYVVRMGLLQQSFSGFDSFHRTCHLRIIRHRMDRQQLLSNQRRDTFL